ncbi:hypothetical protein AU381_08155 [Sinorhizobium glycinis]|uniref:Uncharacterized protein n=1 Tax=Sinorhizobium glycinis TaxID=1472378 RepID=A0A178XV37_9HYPH|nr:hypothetical protein [Sinorhizobium glycinis]OAP39067.1 hypothetical protein AU381_08155 [Sinorhizobium glycinis]
MNLLRGVHATKVLLLAFTLAMPVGLPATAGSGNCLPQVETRVRHVRLKHRPPHHAWRKAHDYRRHFAGHRRHRSVKSSIDDFSSFETGGLGDVQTRTRHIRRKHWPSHFARRDHNRGRVIFIYGGNYRAGRYSGEIDGSYDFPSGIPGLGTYAGNLSAYQQPGNGIYFRQAGSYSSFAGDGLETVPPAESPKIIVVSPQTDDSACSWEQGVCVVRP